MITLILLQRAFCATAPGVCIRRAQVHDPVATLTGALSDRIPVRRLQVCMVKVVPQHVFDVA